MIPLACLVSGGNSDVIVFVHYILRIRVALFVYLFAFKIPKTNGDERGKIQDLVP